LPAGNKEEQDNGQDSQLAGTVLKPKPPEKKNKKYSLNRNCRVQQALNPYYLQENPTRYLVKSKGIIPVQFT
jgi:hypothetical protein